MKTRTGNLFKRGSTYYVQWKVNGKNFKQSTGTGDLRKAESKRAEIMAPFAVGAEADVLKRIADRIGDRQAELVRLDEKENPPTAIKDSWTAYLQSLNRPEISPGTLRNYESYWQSFADWMRAHHAGVKEMRGVAFEHAEGYITALIGRGVSGRTVNAHRSFLRAFWNVLGDKAKTDGNVWTKIAKRDERSQGRRALTVEELRRVCGSAQGDLRVLLALGLYLGARLGDCALMDWGSVDMVRRVVTYAPRKTARKAPAALSVPIHPELYALLAETPTEGRTGPLCPDMADRYARRGADGVSDLVQAHFEACGLATTTDRAGAGVRRCVSVGFHSMRHTAVSLLRDAGAAQSVSMALVGHNDAAVHRLYTHVDGGAMQRAVGALPGVLTDGGGSVAPREPLPGWARKLIEGMTAGNCKRIKAELLKGGVA